MKLIFVLLIIFTFDFAKDIMAQDCDILYFCEKYENAEINCSDRFTSGFITVVVRLAKPIYFDKVNIQLDKYNPEARNFAYYEQYPFDVDSEMTYIYFPSIEFKEPGFYRVFLLDPRGNNITSALVEII